MTSDEKVKKLHEIADALKKWGEYNEEVTNASEWGTPEAKQIIRKAMTLLVDNLALLNECKNKYGLHGLLQQCFANIGQAASWPKTKDLGDCRGWCQEFTKRPLWEGERRSFADECVRYANEVGKETKNNGDTYINTQHVSLGDDAQHAGRDIHTITPEPDEKKGGWGWIKKVGLILGIIVSLIVIVGTCNKYIRKDEPAMEQVSFTYNTDMAKEIVKEHFQLNDDSISEFNAVWCDLISNGKSREFYATYYHNQFTKYLTVFTTRGNVSENLFHQNSKGGYDLQGAHVLINDITYFLCATRVGSGGFLNLYVFQYDGINKLERIHTEASLFQGHLWVMNNRIFLDGGNHRYELTYTSDGFNLIDYDKRVQYLEHSASHVLAYHIDGNDFKITYDGEPIQFTMIEDRYVNNEPITLSIDEQIIEDDNIIGVEPQGIRLLLRRGEFDYKQGFFCSLIPTGVGLKELSISFNYETWYHIKVLVETN